MRVILKVFKYVLIILFSLILILYASLNIYVKSKEIKVDKNELLRSSTISLSYDQIKIASIVLNENSNPKFHNYFFLKMHHLLKRNNYEILDYYFHLKRYLQF